MNLNFDFTVYVHEYLPPMFPELENDDDDVQIPNGSDLVSFDDAPVSRIMTVPFPI